jgi:hypothetical protein
MKRVLLFIFLLPFTAAAQNILTGRVVDAGTNEPINAASVFLNNTSIGTSTNTQGQFRIQIPAGKFELIVSSIGYETINLPVSGIEITETLVIKMNLKAKELETVVIEPFEKDGWEKWGRLFLENFIGTSEGAGQCKILNHETIRFRYSKVKNLLTAIAMEPLVIENKSLGYNVVYQLEQFQFDFKNKFLFFQGYPFFKPMEGSAAKQRRWESRRADAYSGSILHFMRAIFTNKLKEEGFEVRSLKKIVNEEKQRVRAVYGKSSRKVSSAGGAVTVTHSSNIPADSLEYYEKILKQKDYFEEIGKQVLPGDSIAFAVDKAIAGLEFPDYLLVIFKNKQAPPEYRRVHPENGSAIVSHITLLHGGHVEIYHNGMYYDPANMLSLGYWSWSEKISAMLPFDYWP